MFYLNLTSIISIFNSRKHFRQNLLFKSFMQSTKSRNSGIIIILESRIGITRKPGSTSSKNIYKFNLIETSVISIQNSLDFIIKHFTRFLPLLHSPERFCVTFSELQHVSQQTIQKTWI